MGRVFQFVFVAFYLAASYATAADRTTDIVADLQHSNARSGAISIADAGKIHHQYANFREAKKVVADIGFDSRSAVSLLLPASARQFSRQNVSFKSLSDLEISLSRAPPAHL